MKSRIQKQYETSPQTLVDLLEDLDIELPRPRKLTDRELTAKLWEVIHALLAQSIVLCNTDHLSDRELYTLLWNETLRKEYLILPRYALYIDMTRTGIDDGIPVYLQYYASEGQRQLYADIYPDFKMPDRVEPPRRRDHLIPDIAGNLTKKRVN
jgi:hypothetical protein